MHLIVAVHGKKHHGKDSICTELEKSLRGNVVARTIRFADELKHHTQRIWKFTDAQMRDPVLKETGDPRYPRPDGTFLAAREAMQKLGTDYARSCYPDIWVDRTIEVLKDWSRFILVTDNRVALIPDLRFENEYDGLQKYARETGLPVLFVKVVRPSVQPTDALAHHASENEIERPFHTVYSNTGTLDDLAEWVENELYARVKAALHTGVAR